VCPDISEAPAPQGGASRQRNIIYIVPLYLAYRVGLAGHVPVKESEALHPCLPALNRAGTEQGGRRVPRLSRCRWNSVRFGQLVIRYHL
jgi:hypothetical protein